jgi:hypothetical protein
VYLNVHDDEFQRETYSTIRTDADSAPIRVDNCCTRTISGDIRDFIEITLKSVTKVQVKSYGGKLTKITHQGTIKWDIVDDAGTTQHIVVPNSYLVPTVPTRLLSTQHWAQERRQINGRGLTFITNDKHV